jgi:hypothetical protein
MRRIAAMVAVIGVVGAGAQTAGATVTIGSADVGITSNVSSICGASRAFSNAALPGQTLTSPVNGTVTSWRMQGAGPNNTVQLRVIKPLGGTSFLFVSSGPVQSGVPAGPQSFPASVPIAIGDKVADGCTGGAISAKNGISGAVGLVWVPPPPDGSQGTATEDPGYDYLVNATIEPTNTVSVGKVTATKKGKALVDVSAPNPGTLTAATAPPGTAAAAKARPGVKPVTLTVGAPSTVTLTLKPNKRTKRLLQEKGKAKALVSLTFTPSFGSARSTAIKVKFKLKR